MKKNGLVRIDNKIRELKGKIKKLNLSYVNCTDIDKSELILGVIMSNKYDLRILRKDRKIIKNMIAHNKELELMVKVTEI